MTLRKLCLALLTSTALFGATTAFADDDDDDDRKKDRHHRHGKHSRNEVHFHHHHHYHYLPSGALIERPGPPPLAHRDPVPAPSAKPGFPRESDSDRASAKGRQREILQKELAIEEQLLATARVAGASEAIELHGRNIAALRRELNNLER